jgi:CHAD domain-containing protein
MNALENRVAALTNAAGPAANNEPDGIHDVRVASRRIRSILRAHKRLFKKAPYADFQCRVKAVTRGLGTARELDVTIALLDTRRKKLKGPARVAANQIIRRLRAQRTEESANVDAGVHLIENGRFQKSIETLTSSAKSVSRCYLDSARNTLNKRLDAVLTAHEHWRQTRSDEDLHQVRIAFKRFRYSCEIFEPVYGAPLKEFILSLKAAQEHLGDWNDVRIARDYVEQYAKGLTGEAPDGVPLLHSQLDREADALLEAYESDAAEFFSVESIAKAQALLASPAAVCCNPKLRASA